MRLQTVLQVVVALTFPLACPSTPAWAWHEEGHKAAARAAVAALPADSLPEFFRAGAGAIADGAPEPDLFTRPIGPPALHDAESPEHRFDIELLEGNAPPARRYDLIALCAARKIDPRRVGFLPYAVCEWTQKLSVALAEHRKWPGNPLIRRKCLLYAGILSHYSADLCQPLHTTIHYDGRAGADGNSPRSGIHMKVDALLGKLSADANAPFRDGPAAERAAAMEDLFAAVSAEVAASHALVDKVYDLERRIPAYEAPLEANSPAAAFAAERLRACARFTASLYLTAWKDSRSIRFPDWHKREEPVGKALDPDLARSETPAGAPAGAAPDHPQLREDRSTALQSR